MTRYSVQLTTTDSRHSVLLHTSRSQNFLTTATRSVAALLAVLSVTLVGFLGMVTSAAPASANFGDMLADVTCRTGVVGLAIEDRAATLSPTTGNGKTQSVPTPYEKYGLSGLTYSQWIGFDTGATLDRDDGKGSLQGTRSIVAELGGDSDKAGLTQWEDATKGNYETRPGLWNVKESCGDAWATGGTSVANGLLWISKLLVFVSGQAFQVATEVGSSAFAWLEVPLTDVVTILKDRLYFNYLAPMTMVAALWIGYVGMFKRQTTVALSGLLWVFAAVIASVAMMTNPLVLTKAVSGAVGGVSQSVVSSITSVSPEDNMCAMATSNSARGAQPQKGSMGGTQNNSEARNTVRAFQCNLWYSFAYTPWVMGQFGQTPVELSAETGRNSFAARSTDSSGNIAYAEDGFVLDVLDDQSGAPLSIRPVMMGSKMAPTEDQNWALYLLDHKSNWDEAPESQKILKARGQMAVYANQLGADDFNSDFRVDDSGNRFAVASLSALGALVASFMTVLISLHILVLDLGIILWVALLPFFSIIALHPGAGRQAATKFLATLLGFGILRIALSAVLGVSVLVMSIVMASAMSMGWLVAMILTVAVAALGIMAHSKVSTALRGTSYLGVQPYSMGGDRFARAAKGGVGGSVLGAGKALMGDRQGAASSLKRASRAVMTDAASRAGGGAGPAPKAQQASPADERPQQPVTDAAQDQGGAGQQPAVVSGIVSPTHEAVPSDSISRVEPLPTQNGLTDGGAGAAPLRPLDESPEASDKDKGGAGPTPVAAVSRLDARDQRSVANREAARIKENLRREGYRPRTVSLGTVLTATAQGAYVGARTGSALSGVRASSQVVAQRRQEILARNAEVMTRVTKAEAVHIREHERRDAALERQKRQDEARASREARQAKAAPALSPLEASQPVSAAKPPQAKSQSPSVPSAVQETPAVKPVAATPAPRLPQAAPALDKPVKPTEQAPVTRRASVEAVTARTSEKSDIPAPRRVRLPIVTNQMELPGMSDISSQDGREG